MVETDERPVVESADELEKARPPVSWREKRKLLREIRRVATRLRKGSISEAQYSAIVLYNSQRLTGEIAAGESLLGWEFGAWTHLPVWEILEEGDLARSLRRYGPWNMAGSWLRHRLRPPRELGDVIWEIAWDGEADALLEEARLRLRWWPRFKFAWEERLSRNRRYFPQVSDRLGKMLLAGFAALVGAILGVLTTLVLGR